MFHTTKKMIALKIVDTEDGHLTSLLEVADKSQNLNLEPEVVERILSDLSDPERSKYIVDTAKESLFALYSAMMYRLRPFLSNGRRNARTNK